MAELIDQLRACSDDYNRAMKVTGPGAYGNVYDLAADALAQIAEMAQAHADEHPECAAAMQYIRSRCE